MKRRKFLGVSSISALSLIVGTQSALANNHRRRGGGGGTSSNGSTTTTTTTTTSKALPIPALIRPIDRNGVKHFDLNVNQAQHEFFDGVLTSTFSISSTYLGPTLLLTQGDDVSLNYTNNLNEVVTMHGHGMHLPPEMDGTPHQEIAAGTTWSAKYTVNQKACTNWYHPHTHYKTPHHVYQGLAGMIIIEDDEINALDLPSRYGIDDIPVVLQDRFFTADKTALDYTPSRQQIARGYIGDVFITNGAIEPTFDAEAKEIRFRLLNGSNSTVYDLGFSNGKSFKQIGGDNSLLESPVTMSRVVLSPGERAEIVVDLSNDTGTSFTLHEYRNNKTFMTINVNKSATASTTVPSALTTLDPIDLSQVTTTRPFTLEMTGGKFTINRKSMDMNRIDEIVPLGDTEIWEVSNRMGMDHNFHMHATHFRVIERNGSASNVLENEKGYKDVVYLKGNESVKLLVKMTDYTNDTVPYMYHCHWLEHENDGMMGQFIVV